MLRTLHVENFRALREFRMTGLGRVNLLVGTNNCGKTSVLEAVHVLLSANRPSVIWDALVRRGELHDTSSRSQAEIGHLVHGHRSAVGSRFAITGTNSQETLRADAVIRLMMADDVAAMAGLDPVRARRRLDLTADEASELSRQILEVVWAGDAQPSTVLWPMTVGGGLDLADAMAAMRMAVLRVWFVTTEGLSPREITDLFAQVALTPDESFVLDALRTIEPALERIAIVDARDDSARWPTTRTRGGLAVMVAGQRVPIGSMGDGIWRLLGIALSLVRARDGVLLVDEIDTGLHYTVLEKMWRLVFETAERLNVQVFATTHSRDCYEALAAITQRDRREVSIQRIERGRVDAIGFSEGAIAAAAAGDIEVR